MNSGKNKDKRGRRDTPTAKTPEKTSIARFIQENEREGGGRTKALQLKKDLEDQKKGGSKQKEFCSTTIISDEPRPDRSNLDRGARNPQAKLSRQYIKAAKILGEAGRLHNQKGKKANRTIRKRGSLFR